MIIPSPSLITLALCKWFPSILVLVSLFALRSLSVVVSHCMISDSFWWALNSLRCLGSFFWYDRQNGQYAPLSQCLLCWLLVGYLWRNEVRWMKWALRQWSTAVINSSEIWTCDVFLCFRKCRFGGEVKWVKVNNVSVEEDVYRTHTIQSTQNIYWKPTTCRQRHRKQKICMRHGKGNEMLFEPFVFEIYTNKNRLKFRFDNEYKKAHSITIHLHNVITNDYLCINCNFFLKTCCQTL